jgi:predicted GNAT superfamily acetyltransferase
MGFEEVGEQVIRGGAVKVSLQARRLDKESLS